MKRIYKDLKKQANDMLPDENFKQSIKSQIVPSCQPEKMQSVHFSRSKLIKGLAVASAVLILAIVMVFGFAMPFLQTDSPQNGNTVVLIDINPSFEIVADENNKVQSITGLNSDARIVLLGKNYVGKDLYEVCNDIVVTAIHLNYLDAVSDIVNIVAVNNNKNSEKNIIKDIKEYLGASVGNTANVVVSDSNAAKQKLIEDIVLQYGQISGLDSKTVAELHRILMAYDITKEEELDQLEDMWEEELEKAGFDDDIAEDIIDKWKEENLKPLGDCLDEEIEDYLEIYELKLIYQQNTDEDKAEELTEAEYKRIKQMGGRTQIRKFIDEWWIEIEAEFFELKVIQLQEKGKTQEEINSIITKIKEDFEKDKENKKETITDFFEDYYDD